MPNLKLIVSVGGKWNPSIDKDVAMARGVTVCFTSGAVPGLAVRRTAERTRR